MKNLFIIFACLGSFMVNAQATYTMELLSGHGLTATYAGSVDNADVDNDGDEDLLILGADSFNISTGSTLATLLFLNNGSGVYTQGTNHTFPDISGNGIFADIDSDGDIDVALFGSDGNNGIAEIHLNDGTGNFTYNAQYSQNIEPLGLGTADFGDLDNDGDLDLVTQGGNGSQIKSSIYENNNGTFTEVGNLEEVFNGSLTIFDYNNDGHMDILLTGDNNTPNGSFSNLYENDGTGNFSFVLQSTPFTPVSSSTTAVSDIDNDGDMDVVIGGQMGSGGNQQGILETYRNNGNGTFTLIQSLNGGIEDGSIAFGDANRDGFPDLLVTGQSSAQFPIAKLYENDGTGNFTLDTSFQTGVQSSSAIFARVNNDVYDDIIYTGDAQPNGSPFHDPQLRVYVNTQTAGVSDFGKEGLVLYPNPTRGVVNVKLSNNIFIDKVIVSDMSGRQLRVIARDEAISQIDLSSLAKGMYLVRLVTENSVSTKRVLKY